jgi:AraC-like DNA-binding protein
MPEGTVAASLVLAMADFAAARGGSRGKLLQRAGIEPAVLSNRDNRVSIAAYKMLVRAAADDTGDPALALHFGAEVDLSEISIVGLIGLASETMEEALVQLNRFGRLVIEVDLGDARFVNAAGPNGIWVIDQRRDPNDFPELTEITFARMLVGARRIAPTLVAHEVLVTHSPPAHAAAYEEVLGAPVRFCETRNAFRVEPSFVTHRINKHPRYVFGILSAHAEGLLKAMADGQSMRGQVEAALLPILHTGEINAATLAAKLGMSRLTLYRRLKEEGQTYLAVLDDLRRRLAIDYLTARKVSVNETAYLVGYSEAAAFSRAFKRWTGLSPNSYKA